MFLPFIVAITCTTGVLVHRMALHRRWTSDDNLIYFASHAALNAYVCQTALPYVVDMLDTSRFISSTPGLLPGASDCRDCVSCYMWAAIFAMILYGFALFNPASLQSTRSEKRYVQTSIGSIDHAVIYLVRCQHWHASCVGFVSLSLPNEDLGRIDKRGNPDFRYTFQGREYSIWATNH
jgi:hypothetical protein